MIFDITLNTSRFCVISRHRRSRMEIIWIKTRIEVVLVDFTWFRHHEWISLHRISNRRLHQFVFMFSVNRKKIIGKIPVRFEFWLKFLFVFTRDDDTEVSITSIWYLYVDLWFSELMLCYDRVLQLLDMLWSW